jgi:Transmembrane domain of unknown function (DUF3566)
MKSTLRATELRWWPMSTADAFDDPIARVVRPPRVITEAVDSAPTVLRDPLRRNGSAEVVAESSNASPVVARPAVPAAPSDDGWPASAPRPQAAPLVAAPLARVSPPDMPTAAVPATPSAYVEAPVVPGTYRPDPGLRVPAGDVLVNDVEVEVEADVEVEDEQAIEVPVKRSRRPRVRKVSRVVRRIDPWTVFKIAFVLFVLLYAVLVVAGVILWDLANKTGTVDNIQGAVKELFALQTFVINGKKLFRASWALGAIMAIGGTGMAVTLAVLFNLIADLVGGVRITVLEEEYIVREARKRRGRSKP